MTNRNPTENFTQVSFFRHSVPHSRLSLGYPDLPVCSPVRESLQHLLFFVQPSPWVGCSLGYPCVPCDSSWQTHECSCAGHGTAQCLMSLRRPTLDSHNQQARRHKSRCPHNTCTSARRRITLPRRLG